MIAEGNQLAVAIDSALEEMETCRPVEIVLDIVLARPQQLHRYAGLLCDPGSLRHEIAAQTPTKSAAAPRHVHGHIVLRDTQCRRDQFRTRLGVLRGRP